MRRRDFLGWSAASGFAAASLKTRDVFARERPKDRTGAGVGPRYQPPSSPLPLGPWKYGKGSFATDTVLMFRGNPSHTFYGTGPLADKLSIKWKFRMEDYPTTLRGQPKTWQGVGWTGTACKLGNYVYVGSVGRNVYAFEAMTGKVAWRHRASGMFKGSMCVYDNKLYLGNIDNHLHCYDAATGKRLWRHNTGKDLDSSPCVVDGRLYIAGESGYARCIDPQTGKPIWKTHVGGTGRGTLPGSNGSETSPAVVDGEYYTATFDGILYSLNASDGSIRWKAKTGDDTDSSPVVYGDYVYTAAEDKASILYCFSRKDGREVWRYTKGRRGYYSTAAVANDRVYIGADDGRLHCVDAKTGKQLWTYKTGAAIWSSPAVVDGKVVVGGIDSKLHMIDATTGAPIWHHKVPGRILASPCIVDGHIWIGTATGYFFCFAP